MLIVGRVAGLREHLRWFDDRPLFGRRIVVTRSREQAAELVEMLEERGADAIQAPTIRIAPPDDPEALDRACAMAGSYDWIVFTSANAVDAFMRRLLALGDIRDLKGVRICAIGPSTAERVSRHGIRIDLMPEESRAEAVIDAFKLAGDLTDQRILLPRADIAREVIADELRAAHADVTEVIAVPHAARRRRARRRPRRLSDAARSPDRRRHVHERVNGPELRPDLRSGAGRRSPERHRRRVDRSGDGRSGAAARNRDARSCRSATPFRIWSTRSSSTSRRRADRRHGTTRSPETARTELDLRRRPRRLRRTAAMRALVRETRLSPENFLYPLFVRSGEGQRHEIASMPGVFQLSVDEAVKEAAAAKADGVPGVLLFGLPDAKDSAGIGGLRSGSAGAERRPRAQARGARTCWSSPTCACASTRRTATAASWSTTRSPTTRRSRSWSAPRSRMPRPAPTSSRRPT